MNLDDELLIERYLRGELSEVAQAAFLERLEKDAPLKERVKLEKELFSALSNDNWSYIQDKGHDEVLRYQKLIVDDRDNLKTSINRVATQFKRDTKSSRTSHANKFYRYRYQIVSIAAIFVFFVGYIFIKEEQRDYQKALDNAWALNVGLDFDLRNTHANSENNVQKAFTALQNEQYAHTLFLLEAQNSTDTLNQETIVLRAIAEFKMGHPKSAFKTLDTLESYSPNISKWYRGLFYLEQDSIEKALDYLEISAKNDIKLKN